MKWFGYFDSLIHRHPKTKHKLTFSPPNTPNIQDTSSHPYTAVCTMMSSLAYRLHDHHRVWWWWLPRTTATARAATTMTSVSPATTRKRRRSYHNSATAHNNTTTSSRTSSSTTRPPQCTAVRLNKYLVVHQHAQSRRDATMFIENGWVKVNGETVSKKDYDKSFWIPSPPSSSSSSSSTTSSLSSSLYPSQPPPIMDPIIELDPQATEFQQRHRSMTILLNKPLGILSGMFGEPSIKQHPHPNAPSRQPYKPAIKLLTIENMHQPQQRHHEKHQQKALPDDDQPHGGSHQPLSERRSRHGPRPNSPPQPLEPYQLSKLAVAGRLDINTTGLLLLTQDGHLAAQIIGPQSEIEKEYLVRISTTAIGYDREDAVDELYDKIDVLRRGIECGSDFLQAKSVDLLHSTNHYDDFQLRFILTRGKKHHIRRMVQGVQSKVTALKRVRIGQIVLGSLPTGKWRYKSPHERL